VSIKGDWIFDEQRDVWHLSMGYTARSDGDPHTITTWCGLELDATWPKKKGAEIDWSNTLHDSCVRKSEEIG
jgi:hypothetical protein